MTDVMKAVIMDLLFGNHFPASCEVISEDPDYIETCDEIDNSLIQIKEKVTDDAYEDVAELIALKEIADGYLALEYFYSGLVTGYELYERIKWPHKETEKI